MAQERDKRKKTRHAQVLADLQGSPMAKPESLMDKAGGKCLTCRQAGHWANLVTSLLKQLATNAINWDTG